MDYGGGPDNARYMHADQITKANVGRLEVAWTYPTRDNISYVFGPIIVDNVMYVLARNNSLVALDATTGKEIWIHAEPAGHRAARHQLLGEPGPQRPAAALPAQQLPRSDRRADRASRS